MNLPNVVQAEIFYHWNLIRSDGDENEFVDAAICGNADFIVSNDKRFDVLQKIKFPPVKCLSSEEFIEVLTNAIGS